MENTLKILEQLSIESDKVKLYPVDNIKEKTKLLSRFHDRLFWLDDTETVIKGWLGKLYQKTNGFDICNFYIVPYNNYLNKKPMPFDDFCREWIVNQDNENEILADFYAFMTNKKQNIILGYLDNLKDAKGNNFIGFSVGKPVNNICVIASSFQQLMKWFFQEIAEGNEEIEINKDPDFWRSRDSELDVNYKNGNVLKYKMQYLFQDGSVNLIKESDS